MKTYVFRVVVEPDEDRWFAYCPVLEEKGGATWGYTREEALRNIREVVEMTIESLIEHVRETVRSYHSIELELEAQLVHSP